MDAFDKDSAAIGLRSKTHVVLACVKEADEVASLPRLKILKVDDHIGVAFADLPAKFKKISQDLQFECNNYKLTFGSPLPVRRLVEKVQRSWKQPSGDGLLAAGSDESGAYLYHSCPSGNDFEYQAFAIGSRSQAAKTYLECRFETFTNSSREDLIKDALIAIRETLQGERLKSSICTVAVVGVGEPFHILDQETIQQLIDAFEIVAEEEPPAAKPAAAAEEGAAAEQGAPAEEGAAPDEGVVPMEL